MGTVHCDDAQLLVEERLRRLGYLYAHAVDNGEVDILREIFTEDALLVAAVGTFGPFEWRKEGIEQIVTIPGDLKASFAMTQHCVQTQSVVIAGDTASGDTYSINHHVMQDRSAVLDTAVTYRNRFVRRNGQWRFARRDFVAVYQEVRALAPVG